MFTSDSSYRTELPIPGAIEQWAGSTEAEVLAQEVCAKTSATRIVLNPGRGKATFAVTGESERAVAKAVELMRLHLSFQVDVQKNEVRKRQMETEVRRTKPVCGGCGPVRWQRLFLTVSVPCASAGRSSTMASATSSMLILTSWVW